VIRLTSFVHLRDDAPPGALDELVALGTRLAGEVDALSVQAAPTGARVHRAGQLMLLAAFRDQDQLDAARRHRYVTDVLAPAIGAVATNVETVRYAQGAVDLRQPGLTHGVQRTLLLRVLPDAPADEVRRFLTALGAMPRYIDTIRNSSVSRVDEVWGATATAGLPWTHVWEQEYETLDGLLGPYMQHAYHWAWVDRWFDPQQPIHIVDTTLVHAMCELGSSILSLEPSSVTSR
jgi:hypothetical protein